MRLFNRPQQPPPPRRPTRDILREHIENGHNWRQRMHEQMLEIQRQEMERLVELSSSPEPLYRVMSGEDIGTLQHKVDKLLALGWQVQGGLQHTKTDRHERYMQAMFKPAMELPPPNHFEETEFKV